ncbi:uncharacterized protein JCM15063_003075 [Sporobolomyces koalae]|uniref:uncharacterized protein n=1 Tax=Sporobolomyces koalae TaxID=500713 RepID=UPI003178F3F2
MLPSQNGGWQPHPIFPVMDEIVLHAKGREEASEIWLGQMKQTLVRTWMDKDLTLVTLKTVLDRVKKGEYLMNFDNTLNPEFTPMNLIRFPSNEYALPSSLRPNSLSTESLIQIHGFSEPADDERAFERKMREAIDGIARFYAKKHADCRAKADRWSRQMKDQLVGVSIAANAYALIRWNLIVAAEQVRCDQILPDSKVGLSFLPVV